MVFFLIKTEQWRDADLKKMHLEDTCLKVLSKQYFKKSLLRCVPLKQGMGLLKGNEVNEWGNTQTSWQQ